MYLIIIYWPPALNLFCSYKYYFYFSIMILSVTIFKYFIIGCCILGSYIVSYQSALVTKKTKSALLFKFLKSCAVIALISLWLYGTATNKYLFSLNGFIFCLESFLIFFIPSVLGLIRGFRSLVR